MYLAQLLQNSGDTVIGETCGVGGSGSQVGGIGEGRIKRGSRSELQEAVCGQRETVGRVAGGGSWGQRKVVFVSFKIEET